MSLPSASPAPPSVPAGGGGRDVDPSSVGMMEGAFFVSRTDLLEWANSTLALSLSRVEQCASGCVYLQALDCLLGPKSRVAMSKVKWGAKHEYEFVQNYKVLQAAFDAHHIQKYIEVNKLVKAKYQDNLEFLQWLKAFCDRQAPLYATDTPYDPIERRKLGIGPFPSWAPVYPSDGSAQNTGAGASRKPAAAAAFAASTATGRPTASATPSSTVRSRMPHHQQNNSKQPVAAAAGAGGLAGAPTQPLHKRQHLQQEQHLQQQQQLQRGRQDPAAAATAAAVEALRGELQQAILERDFYYSKLRRIEILCGAPGQQSLTVEQLQAILYSTDDDEGAVGPQ